jgi:hypothetical protein
MIGGCGGGGGMVTLVVLDAFHRSEKALVG